MKKFFNIGPLFFSINKSVALIEIDITREI